MVDLDLDRFWRENALSTGKPFRTDKPRAPITISLDDHWLIEELGVPSTVRFYKDRQFRQECHLEANDRCHAVIGIRPFAETLPAHSPRRIEEVFLSRQEVLEGGTPWLEPGVGSPSELQALLDDLEDIGDETLTARAEIPHARPIESTTQVWSRGPATVATSVLGTTEAMFALVDEPELMERFFRVLADTVVRYGTLVAASQGCRVSGLGILDDNCALLSSDSYRRFCLPVWKQIAAAFAPLPDETRFQHSDSAMAHLLPVLAELNLTGANFGPTIPAATIRAAMPRTEIHGQLAPFTLRDGSAADVEAEVRRDWEAVGGDGGWVCTTAGSIPAGTSLEAIRRWMAYVDRNCRYDVGTTAP